MKTESLCQLVILGSACVMLAPPILAQSSSVDQSTYLLRGDDIRGTATGSRGGVHYRYRAILGDPTPEVLPAEKDTGGNWGIPGDLWQLSLRLHRTEFVPGEQVGAVAILRNLGADRREVFYTWFPGYLFGIHFTLGQGTNMLTSRPTAAEIVAIREEGLRRNRNDLDASLPSGPIFPRLLPDSYDGRSQKMFVANLSELFNLSQPGEYTVQAHLPVRYSTNEVPVTEIASGAVSFQIVEELSPAGLKQKQDWENELKDLERRVEPLLRQKTREERERERSSFKEDSP